MDIVVLPRPMIFSYCIANVSLTQRILKMLRNRLGAMLSCTTVIFFNDCWIIRIILEAGTSTIAQDDCRAILQENGVPYRENRLIQSVFQDLDRGEKTVEVMNRYKVVILSHGAFEPDEISCFQKQFISG